MEFHESLLSQGSTVIRRYVCNRTVSWALCSGPFSELSPLGALNNEILAHKDDHKPVEGKDEFQKILKLDFGRALERKFR